ncbi:YveK family protein [Priestia megaterium]|uniref:YveK family protein n=1 Tax=Priestia megaterium TaxID=1404 RepID=UPI000BFE9402|nr:Wzz/FepE/Etk N-terminal domain-containing protein [Priestia megaterium]PGT76802.1 capsular biosynthesis protein [Priestia megaterium]
MDETISIKDLLQTLKKRWMIIVLLTLLSGITSGVISYYVLTPVYQASTQILVNQKDSDDLALNATQVQTNVDLINTYSVIIKSPSILEKVVKELHLKQSVGALNQQVTVTRQENSQVFSLTVQDTDPDRATKIANTLSVTFQKEVPNLMNIDNVSVLSKAVLKENLAPVKPNPQMNILIALVIGLMVSIGLAFLLEYLDNTFKNESDIEKDLGLPVLGSIQKVSRNYKDGF